MLRKISAGVRGLVERVRAPGPAELVKKLLQENPAGGSALNEKGKPPRERQVIVVVDNPVTKKRLETGLLKRRCAHTANVVINTLPGTEVGADATVLYNMLHYLPIEKATRLVRGAVNRTRSGGPVVAIAPLGAGRKTGSTIRRAGVGSPEQIGLGGRWLGGTASVVWAP